MKNNLNEVLHSLENKSVQMILNGLDLLDEYYSEHSEFDQVIACRALKQQIRDHNEDYQQIPQHLIN